MLASALYACCARAPVEHPVKPKAGLSGTPFRSPRSFARDTAARSRMTGAQGLSTRSASVSRVPFDFAQDFGSGLGRPLNASTSLEMTGSRCAGSMELR